MRSARFTPRPLSQRPSAPFASAEGAWLWFWQCQTMREAGARFVADAGSTARPCDPDDIYRAVADLYRHRHLPRHQVEVLARYGRRLVPPDARLAEEAADARDWAEAVGRLEAVLCAKGIVTTPVDVPAPACRPAAVTAP